MASIRQFLKKPWVPWTGTAILLLGLLYWRGLGRKSLARLTMDNLKAARATWVASGVKNYKMEIEVSGVQTGHYFIDVRDGKPVSMTTNGAAVPERSWEAWSVPGMFETLEEELGAAKNPAGTYGVEEPDRVYQGVEFDKKLGYPRQYLRQVFGRQLTIQWRVVSFFQE